MPIVLRAPVKTGNAQNQLQIQENRSLYCILFAILTVEDFYVRVFSLVSIIVNGLSFVSLG